MHVFVVLLFAAHKMNAANQIYMELELLYNNP